MKLLVLLSKRYSMSVAYVVQYLFFIITGLITYRSPSDINGKRNCGKPNGFALHHALSSLDTLHNPRAGKNY